MKISFLRIVSAFGMGVCMVTSVLAQQVGTIGVGDVTVSVKSSEHRSHDDIVNAINSGLNKALTDTRKFTVLNYSELTDRLARSGLTLEGYYNKEYAQAEYVKAGLDYILTVDVTEFDVFEKQRGASNNAIVVADATFKLIGVADLTSDLDSSVSAQVSKPIVISGDAIAPGLLDDAIDQAVDKIVGRVVSSLFPIRVMDISDTGSIKLNYGNGLLSSGDTILIYPKAQKAIFNELGKLSGKSVATLQVISTEKKFSIAQALDGFTEVEKGLQGQLVLTGG